MKDKSFAGNSAEPGKKSVVVGLDIGTTKIACFVGVKNEHGKIEIISQGKSESLGVKKGVVSNIRRTIQSIQAAIENTEQNCKEGNLMLSNVVVGIGSIIAIGVSEPVAWSTIPLTIGDFSRRTVNREICSITILVNAVIWDFGGTRVSRGIVVIAVCC